VVADRFDRRKVMIVSDLLRAGIVLGFLLVDRPERLWLVYALSVAQFVVSAFFEPARAALVPALVAEPELLTANTLSSVTWSAMLALGAALGGVTAAALGAPLAMLIDAGTFLASAGLVLGIRTMARGRGAQALGGWGDFLAGLRYVHGQAGIRWVALVKGLGQVGSVDVMAAAFALRVFPLGQEGAAGLGLMLAANGLGAILGPLVGNRFHDHSLRQLRRAILGGFVMIIGGWFLLGAAPSLPVVLLAFLLRGMGGSLNWTYSDVLLQMQTADRFLGRVFSLNLAFFTLMLSVSVWLNGYVLDRFALEPRQVALGLAGLSLGPALIWLGALRPAAEENAAASPPRRELR
jgi:predicted MFS family arabinose efflux permease